MAQVKKIHSDNRYERRTFKIDYNQMMSIIEKAAKDFAHYQDVNIGEEVDLLDDIDNVMDKWFAYPQVIDQVAKKVIRIKNRCERDDYLDLRSKADDERTAAHNDAVIATGMLYRICTMMDEKAPFPNPEWIHRRDIGKGICDFVVEWTEKAF